MSNENCDNTALQPQPIFNYAPVAKHVCAQMCPPVDQRKINRMQSIA